MFITKKHLSRRTVLQGRGQLHSAAAARCDAARGRRVGENRRGKPAAHRVRGLSARRRDAATGRPRRRALTHDASEILSPLAKYPRADDDRLWPAQQACREPEPHTPSSSARGCSASARSRRASRSGRRRHSGPDRRAPHRPGDGMPSLELTTAHRAAARSRSARRLSRCRRRATRATVFYRLFGQGDNEAGARGDRPRDGQHSRPRHGAGRWAASEARRARPRGGRRVSLLRARDRAPRADELQSKTTSAGHSRGADRRAERLRLAFQADVRLDGVGVPSGLTRVITFSDGQRERACARSQLEHLRSVPSAVASRQGSRRSKKLASIQNIPYEAVRGVHRAAREHAGRLTATLLDHSVVLYGSNMSDSDRHNNDPLPAAMLGRAHGRIKGRAALAISAGCEALELAVHVVRADARSRFESIGDSDQDLSEV